MTDREARFRSLFDATYQPLQAFARRRCPAAEADDLVAEVLTVAWRRLEDIPPGQQLPWLYGVAHRTLANQRRATTRRLRLIGRIADAHPRPGHLGDEPLPVIDALGTLRPDDQEILRLAAWEELTTAELATVLGCSTNAATLRLSRARRRLREAMTATGSIRTQDHRRVTDA